MGSASSRTLGGWERSKWNKMSLEDTLYPLLKLYEAAPQPVKSLAGRAYRAIPASLRYGQDYTRFQREACEVEAWDAAAIESYQLKALRESLCAAARAPFYAERFQACGVDPMKLESLSQLADYPLLTKQDLITHREQMVNPAFDASQRLYLTTGGSSGVPVGFYLHKGVSRPKEQAYLEAQWSRRGYRVGDRVAVIRGGVTSSHADGCIASQDASRNSLILSSYHLTEQRAPEYIAALNAFCPQHLHMYPSSAQILGQWMEATNAKLEFSLTSVLCGSEKLTPAIQAWMQRVFGAPVNHWYGHSERVVLAGQGRTSDHLYFCPTYGYVEFGEPDEEGLCEVIGTSFHNLVMPLIRYRTGDRVRLVPESQREREFYFPEIAEVAGRDHEFLVSASGRRIALTAINMHDESFDGFHAVQFAQLAPGVVECRCLLGGKLSMDRAETIRAGLLRKLGDDFDLRVVQVTELEKTPSGKHRWLAPELSSAASIASKPEPLINAVTFHDAKAADWEQLYQRPSFQLRRKVIMGLLQPHLRDGERWLDAGCGSGYFARELANAGADVIGVDAAMGMVEESMARATSEPHAARMSFQQVETIERLPFADASFDGVLCSSVIEYVHDYAQALRELGRVLRPGGVLLVTVPNKVAMTRVLERGVFAVTSQVMEEPWPRYLQHSRWQFSEATLRSAMAEQRLVLQAVDYFGPAMPAWLNRHRSCGMMLAALAVKR